MSLDSSALRSVVSEISEAAVCAICDDFVNWTPQNGTSWRRHRINYLHPKFLDNQQTYTWAYYHHSNIVTLKDSAENGCPMCQLLYDSLGFSVDNMFNEEERQELRASHSSLNPTDARNRTFVEEIIKQIEYENRIEITPDESEGGISIYRHFETYDWLGINHMASQDHGDRPVVLLAGDARDRTALYRYGSDLGGDERYSRVSIAEEIASGSLGTTFEIQARVPCSSPDTFDVSSSLWCTLEGTVLHEDAIDPESTHRPSRDLLSEAHLTLIRSWRERCLTTHKACSRNSPQARLPSRVIEIKPTCGEITEVSVIETHRLEGKHEYVCLSYCWGATKQINKTTKAEFPRRLTLDRLPATIADAIRLCHALNYRYLWVDSLCIIQGDVKDWEAESAQMCNIYGGSSLTIATEICDDSAQSFIHLRKQRLYFSGPRIFLRVGGMPSRFKRRIWFHKIIKKQENSMWNVEKGTWEPNHRDYQKSMWLQRAWTYQEWMLSPKVLHIDQMTLWDCFEGHANEMTQRSIGAVALLRDLLIRREDHDWAEIIRHYALRSLSKDIDRLPALGGIAQLYQKGSGYTYLAGLWLEEMPLSLTWCREGRYAKRSSGYTKGHIPSWSWASVETSFRMPDKRPRAVFASIESYSCEYKPPDSLLQVKKHAWLEIKGPLARIESCSDRDEDGCRWIRTAGTSRYPSPTAIEDVREPDFHLDVAAGEIFVLSLAVWPVGIEPWLGLVLREVYVSGGVTYLRRVGLCSGFGGCSLKYEPALIRLL